MRIDHLYLKNFRGLSEISIIGDNGSGKTAVLEALTLQWSPFLGVKNADSRHIRESDERLKLLNIMKNINF